VAFRFGASTQKDESDSKGDVTGRVEQTAVSGAVGEQHGQVWKQA